VIQFSVIKVAVFENDIFPYLQKYSNKFTKIAIGLNVKFTLIENNAMLMLSQNKVIITRGDLVYNVMFTVTPIQQNINLQFVKKFEESMPFVFKLPPQEFIDDLLRKTATFFDGVK